MILCTALWAAAQAQATFEGVALDRDFSMVTGLDIARESRDTSAPEEVPVSGPWRAVSTSRGVRMWEAPLPVRPRTLFFHRPPDGMAVMRQIKGVDSPTRVPHKRGFQGWQQPNSWDFTTHAIRVRRPIDQGPPKPGEYLVRYPSALERELALGHNTAQRSDEEFLFRSLQVDDITRHGLFLPAPSQVTLTVPVSKGGVLSFIPSLIPPEVDDTPSNATAHIAVSINGDPAWSGAAMVRGATPMVVDLNEWAGQDAEITFVSSSPQPHQAYAFVADPVVYVPAQSPPRVLVVFIDTLRTDHLSTYGYSRNTTPFIDALADESAVFENARSVAPWTLPSARTMLTGAQPEAFFEVEDLPSRLATQGWYTATVVGNVYLSSNFDMAGGWTAHQCNNWPLAQLQADRLLNLMAPHPQRALFVQLHLMDVHLPYEEPLAYRKLFTDTRPAVFDDDSFIRGDVLKAVRKDPDATKPYIIGRYDNNIRYVDDQLRRFLEAAPPFDVIAIVSDHGEEFWEHNGFEHGHTLYDEVLRVPMILRGVMEPGRHDAPVSLLDLAPTLAQWTGLSTAGMTGIPLQELSQTSARFDERPQAVGRPLYGNRIWGVLDDHTKFITKEGHSQLYDLTGDPQEQQNVHDPADVSAWLAAMSTALDAPVTQGVRIFPPYRGSLDEDLQVTITFPHGVVAAWAADSPTNQGKVDVEVTATTVEATWRKNQRGTREVFVVPAGELAPSLREANIVVSHGTTQKQFSAPQTEGWPPAPGGPNPTLFTLRAGRRVVNITWGIAPQLAGDAVVGVDQEMQAALEQLGYSE